VISTPSVALACAARETLAAKKIKHRAFVVVSAVLIGGVYRKLKFDSIGGVIHRGADAT
jgi:hypothetical protein